MPKYKHLVVQNKNMVRRLVKFSKVDEDLVQNIVRFSKCLVKPGTDIVDFQIFFMVMCTYFEIMDHASVMKMFSKLSRHHTDEYLTVEEFARLICVFCTDDLDVRIDLVFTIYDHNQDGLIDTREIADRMKDCTCVTDTDDADKDETYYDLCMATTYILGLTSGAMSVEDFRAKVKENHLILFVLGKTLPNSEVVARFRQRISGKTNLQMKETFGKIRFDLLFELQEPPKYYPILLDLP